MPQFDLYRLRNGQLVVDLQTDLIGIEASRIVAPLRDAGCCTAFPGPLTLKEGKASHRVQAKLS
jgi:toxin CcdB